MELYLISPSGRQGNSLGNSFDTFKRKLLFASATFPDAILREEIGFVRSSLGGAIGGCAGDRRSARFDFDGEGLAAARESDAVVFKGGGEGVEIAEGEILVVVVDAELGSVADGETRQYRDASENSLAVPRPDRVR